MFRKIALLSPVMCLMALALLVSHPVKADDTATSQPSGSISVTVVDSDGKPVNKAHVQLMVPKKKAAEGDDAAPAKPKPIAKGVTDEDGKFTFDNVAVGDYRVNANLKKGGKGNAKVSVTADSLNPSVTITFAAPADAGGGATTAPSN